MTRRIFLILLVNLVSLLIVGCQIENTSAQFSSYKVEWIGHQVPSEMTAAAERNITLTLKNTGNEAWKSEPPYNIAISYHWYKDDNLTTWDGKRTGFPHDIAPGEQITIDDVRIETPKEPGLYKLQLTLVHENVTWFEAKGASVLLIPVNVR